MKAKLFFLSLLVLITNLNTHAQPLQHNGGDPLHTKSAASIHNHSTAKVTGINSRPIAACDRHFNGTVFVIQDSTSYSYSGVRGGTIDYPSNPNEQPKFDTSIYYNYDTTANSYIVNELIAQTFNANNNIVTKLGQEWSGGAYVNDNQVTYTYDANNLVVIETGQNWDNANNVWIPNYRDSFVYDIHNNVQTKIEQIWNKATSSWVNFSRYDQTYNSVNKMTNSISQQWNTNAWVNQYQDLLIYDNANNLIRDTSKIWSTANNVWEFTYLISYTYDNMNNQVQALYQPFSGGTWVNDELDSFSNFVAQQPQIDIYKKWDATNNVWVNDSKFIYTYNSNNKLTMEVNQSWTGSDWQSEADDQMGSYYYEEYNLAVKSVSNTGGSAHIYPVPAQDILHIDLVWDAAQACNLTLYDIQGKVLKQWQLPAAKEYHNTIAVNDLAPGNYFIKATGTNGQIVQQLIVTR